MRQQAGDYSGTGRLAPDVEHGDERGPQMPKASQMRLCAPACGRRAQQLFRMPSFERASGLAYTAGSEALASSSTTASCVSSAGGAESGGLIPRMHLSAAAPIGVRPSSLRRLGSAPRRTSRAAISGGGVTAAPITGVQVNERSLTSAP